MAAKLSITYFASHDMLGLVSDEEYQRFKDELLEHQKEVKAALDKHNDSITSQIQTLFEGRNKNANRISRLEIIGSTLFVVSSCLWAFFVWIFPKIQLHLKP